MNYIGSKFRLSPFIEETITQVAGDISSAIFCDIFAGTGIIGRTFKPKVAKVIANDIEEYSYVLQRNYIGNYSSVNYTSLIKTLNNLPGKKGFIFKHYAMGSGSSRQYFSDENAKRIDAMRKQIETWKQDNFIDENCYYFLLASLIESADKVANTASVYAAFLKHLKNSAQEPLILEPALFECTATSHEVYKRDANELIYDISGDILYMDPPYNSRQYGNYYHILNTIINSRNVKPKGVTGMRDYYRSSYCKVKKVADSFAELIKNAKFEFLFLSYNNEGLMSVDTVRDIMSNFGSYQLIQKDYQRFKADRDEDRNHKAEKTIEYLHILRKARRFF